jgi:hypothetical protein
MERPELKDFSLLEILGCVIGGWIAVLWIPLMVILAIAFIAGLL